MLKSLFGSALRAFTVGLSLAAGIALLPTSYAALATFNGPASATNPIAFPADLTDINAAIGVINTAIGNYLTLNYSAASQGEPQFSSSNAFAANGSVATTLGSHGPTGALTQPREWLTVVDESGGVGYIAVF